MISTRKLAFACAAAAILWQGGWSVAAMVAHDAIYDHRLFDLRQAPLTGPVTDNFASAASRFLRSHANPKRPLVVFAGSSVTFGYKFDERAIFSYHIAEELPDANVLNLSIVGVVTPGLMGPLLCAMEIAEAKVDTLVLEIAVINDATNVARGSKNTPYVCQREKRELPIFLTKQIGAEWLKVLPDKYRNDFDARPVQLNPLPADYIGDAARYADVAVELSRVRRSLIAQLRDRVGRLIVFPSPVYVDGLEKLGFDRANIERQIDDAYADCRAIEGVTCLDTRVFSSAPEMFINVTHLGLKGHSLFAEWLLRLALQPVDSPLISQAQEGHSR